MKVIKFFISGVLFTFSILAIIAWVILPGDFEIKEEITVEATETEVFEVLNDLSSWEQWVFDRSVEQKPKIEMASTKIEGIGASMVWAYKEGNRIQVTIEEAIPPKRLLLSFNDLANTESTKILIEISPLQNGSKVLWIQKGDYGWGIGARISASILDFEGETAAIYAAQLKRLKAFIESKEN